VILLLVNQTLPSFATLQQDVARGAARPSTRTRHAPSSQLVTRTRRPKGDAGAATAVPPCASIDALRRLRRADVGAVPDNLSQTSTTK